MVFWETQAADRGQASRSCARDGDVPRLCQGGLGPKGRRDADRNDQISRPWWSRGAWGFISRDDKQPKVFVHIRAAERAGFTDLRRGQRWRFTLVERPKGGFETDDPEMLFDEPPPAGR
ncbi:cold-shock protein [Sphingomonas sanguinis]|uniref:cold-shock protein n=1 Tax=Sphingomonas sanguinis TaxID=33051 RepID=UPI001FD36B29|nr:cold shock domain-containing protein [Sphingomonas sanguinis]HJO64912.1 cold shock domain-containing protein [Sphingomonas sanguinis]